MGELRDDVEVMLLTEFREACRVDAYNDDDGVAYLGDEDKDSRFHLSCGTAAALPEDVKESGGFTHVYWYGK